MGRRTIRALIVTAILVALAGTSLRAQPNRQHLPERYITPIQAAEAITRGRKDIYLLDVRSGWEYSNYHIPGAANIPVQVLANPENLTKIPKGKKVVVYCRTGVRADRALSILKAKGIDAVNMKGGVVAWWRDPLSPPSNTMAPFGRMKLAFKKRRKLRKYILPGSPKEQRR